jgi:transcriptional regulator NrdR family protein
MDENDAFGVYRYRKCRCGNVVETREIPEDTTSGRADRCPICGAKASVLRTLQAGAGVVVRIRECTQCPARFYTREAVFRVTQKVTQPMARNE